MKKLITLLALCCLMVTGAWADPFQYSTSTESPQHVYNIAVGKSGEEAYLTSDGHGTRTTTEFARFAFFQDGSFFKIYCVDSKKWLYVAKKPATTSETVNDLIGVTSNEGDANLWKYQTDDKDASAWDVYTSLSVTDGYQGQDFGLCWCGGWSSTPTQTLGLNYGYHGSAAQARVKFIEAEMPTTQDYKVKYTLTDANGNVYTGNFTGATSDNPFSGVSGMTLTNVSYTDSSTPGYDKDLTATVSFPFTVSNGSDNNYVYISGYSDKADKFYWYSAGTAVKAKKAATPTESDYKKYSWALIPAFNGKDVTLTAKNVLEGKYLTSTSTTNQHASGVVTLTATGSALDYANQGFQLSGGKYISINSSNSNDEQYLGTWDSHSGTKLSITDVPFGNTEDYTVTITGATGATVTYGGTPYTSGQTITAENPTVSQLTASEVPGYYPSIAIGTNTINVTYNLLPFTTGKAYNLTLKGNKVYYDEATGSIKAGNVEDSENTSFIIGGTYADGYTIKSVGADEYLKHENVNNDNAKATTTANESEATRYEYAVKDGYHYFKIRGTDNNYVNYRDGYFSSWKDGNALGNDGSRLTFSEPVDPVKGYHIFQNNGTLNTTGTSDYCSQWTSSHINPQISINVTDGNGAANDMEKNSTYANNGIVCYTGNNRDQQGYKATLTVAASYGYKITGFEFDASKADNSDYTIDVTAGGATKTVSGTTAQHFSQTGVNAQEFVIVFKETAGSATHNKPILFNNFYVTYEAAEPLESEYKLVFDNAHSSVPYRIPAVGQTKDGDLIFVADYRYSGQDIGVVHNGKLDLKMRKKYANGEWGEEETLQACIDNGSEFMAFGDPCIVCDRESNSVMVTSCCGNVSFPNGTYENHQGWARWYSSDGGKTWESSFNTLAPQVVKQLDERQGDQMQAFFIGSGKISQSHIIKKGQYYRLYCASNTRMQSGKCNFVWYSDDFGVTWNLLGSPDVKAINGGDEPKADELPDGSVVISSRDTGRIFNIFHYTDYENAEGYWGSQATSSSNNSGCYGTGCNGEILIVPVVKKSNNTKTYLALQSIPAASDRRNVSIYWKELTDFTKYRNASELAPDWTKFQVSGTTSAYSTMCQMKDGHIAFFYEENSYNNGYDMVYKKFSVEAITDDLYEFYDLNATEKAAYLTSCVGTYFDEETKEIQTLAEAYEADPTMKKYDALNAGIIAALNKTYKKGVAVTQQSDLQDGDLVIVDVKAKNATTDAVLYYVGESTSMSNRNNFRAHINNVTEYPANHVWEVVDVNTSTTPNTFKLRSVADNTVYLPSGNTTSATNTAATFYFKESTGYNDGVNRFALAFSNYENADHYTYHFNAKPATGQGEPICFWGYGAASTDSQGAFAFYKVAEDIPTPALSIETNTTVTSSQLSELTITFTGANAAQVQLSATQHTAYLTPKASTPAQVKAQNGKFKAAPAGAIEGNISATDETGKFSINFGDADIAAGDYELSIPEGTFYVGTEDHPVGVLTASYNVTDDINTPITYSHLSGATPVDPQWTAWEGEVSDGIKAINATKYTASNLWYIEKTYTFTEGQNLNVIFKWSGNSSVDGHRTDVIGVELLNADGSVAYSQYHAGSTGSTDSNNSYTINGIAAGTYKVRYIATTADGQCQTGGTISNVEVPVNGKVYTVYNDHSGNKWYVSSSRDANDCQTLTDTEASDNTQQWIAWGNTTSGYSFYSVASNGTALKAKDGIVFDIVLNHKKTGVTLGQHGSSARHQAGNKETKTLNNGLFTNGYKNEDSNWSTDFVFVPTGEYAYKVITTEGQTVTYNEKTYNKDAFVVSTDKLAANSVTASEITGKTASVSIDNDAMTITVTYEATTTPDGFHIYESNGTYSNTNNQSDYKDKWLSKGTNPQFTILVTQASGSGAANNMYHNETYKDSGILCFTGDAHINNKSMMTVSVQNGYKITGYTFKVKNLEGTTAGNTKVVTTAGQTINTTAANQTVKVSGLNADSFTITLDGSNGNHNEGIVFTDFYVTYEGEPVVEVPATGIYYIYDNNKSGYLYNSSFTSEGPTSLTETSVQTSGVQTSGENPTLDNRLLWYVQSNGTNVITITNGQGTGYKASATDEETHSVNLDDVNWKFTELVRYSTQHTDIDANVFYTDDYPAHFVKLLYCSDAEYNNVFDNAYGIHVGSNPDQYAFNGGFFANHDAGAWNVNKFDYADMSSVNHPEDGLPFTKCRIFNSPSEEDDAFHFYYYTQQDEERYLDVANKAFSVFYEHEGLPGYCAEQNDDYADAAGVIGLLKESIYYASLMYEYGLITREDALATLIEPFEAKYVLGCLNDYIKTLEIAPPVMGDAYHIAVRGNDYTGNTKYYLKNDGTYTANEADADVFVLGGSGDETCGSLLVTNNNPGTEGGIHYLQVRADGIAMNTEYKEADNALNLVSMTKAEGENIQSCPAYLYGTFSATNKDGKVLTFDETGDGSWISDAESLYMKDNKTSAIELIPVEYPYNKPKFAVGSPDDHNGGYASIWLPFPMVFPEGVEAYRATSVENDGILILTKVNEDTNTVAAGGYILYTPGQGEDTDPDNLPLVLPAPADPEDVTPYADNAFVGSTENPLEVKEGGSWAAFREKHPDGTAYVLARKNNVIGYYKYRDTETYLPKGKAIWFSTYKADSSAECLRFTFEEVISAIEALHGNTDNAEIYDLQGHRLNKVEKGQVNVINGKKVMFK